MRLTRPHGTTTGMEEELKLQLSEEHSGFRFEANPDVAVNLLKHHSGGKVMEALKMALK